MSGPGRTPGGRTAPRDPRPPRRRAPVPVAGAVELLAARLEPPTPLAAIQRVWDDAVGDVFAPHTKPVAERGGVVTVECSGATWAQEMTLLSAEVLSALNARLDGVRATELRCIAARRRRAR